MNTYLHTRNFGARINDDIIISGYRAVILENNLIKVTVLAEKGADIYELIYKPLDIDFMWRTPFGLKHPSKFIKTTDSGVNYMDYYEGAWQEIFPYGSSAGESGGVKYGLHGEVWGLPWKHEILKDSPKEVSVKFHTRTYRTPYYIERVMTLFYNDPSVYINEKVVNEGEEDLEFMWGHHPAFGGVFLDENCRFIINAERFEVASGGPTGRFGSNAEYDYPVGIGKNGKKVDISRMPEKGKKIYDMIFIKDLVEGKYEIHNPKHKLTFCMNWDKSIFKIIWYWLVAGGSYGYPLYGRTYTIALEPFSSLPQTMKGHEKIKIGKKKTISTDLSVEIKRKG